MYILLERKMAGLPWAMCSGRDASRFGKPKLIARCKPRLLGRLGAVAPRPLFSSLSFFRFYLYCSDISTYLTLHVYTMCTLQ